MLPLQPLHVHCTVGCSDSASRLPSPLTTRAGVAFVLRAQVRPCSVQCHSPSGSDTSCSTCGKNAVVLGVGAQGRSPAWSWEGCCPGRPARRKVIHAYPVPLYTRGRPCIPMYICVYLHAAPPGSFRVCSLGVWGFRPPRTGPRTVKASYRPVSVYMAVFTWSLFGATSQSPEPAPLVYGCSLWTADLEGVGL